MTADEARDYLELATQTAMGTQALGLLGYSAIADNPRGGDDASTIKIAEAVANVIRRQLADMKGQRT